MKSESGFSFAIASQPLQQGRESGIGKETMNRNYNEKGKVKQEQ